MIKEKAQEKLKKNHDMSEMDLSEIKTILELLRPTTSSSDALGKLIELIAVREIISMFKEDRAKQQQKDDIFSKWMDWYMNMKMLKMLEKTFSLGEEEKEKLKELFEKRDREEQLIKILEKMHEKDREFLSYLKDLQERSIAQQEEYARRLEELLEQLQRRYNEDQLRMFQRFEQVVAELTRKGKFEELKKFVEEFTEFQKTVEEIDRLLEKMRVKKEPLVQEGGKINWDKLLDFLGNILTRGLQTTPPPKKEITVQEAPKITETAPKIETAQPIQEVKEETPKLPEQETKIEEFGKQQEVPKLPLKPKEEVKEEVPEAPE